MLSPPSSPSSSWAAPVQAPGPPRTGCAGLPAPAPVQERLQRPVQAPAAPQPTGRRSPPPPPSTAVMVLRGALELKIGRASCRERERWYHVDGVQPGNARGADLTTANKTR